ncbi:hypothetical protein PO909_000531 [Leuciscus waleckii]
MGSGTTLLERGWTLHHSGVAHGERRQAGVGLLIAPQLSHHMLEFTPVNERVAGWLVGLLRQLTGTDRPSGLQPGWLWRQKLSAWEEFGESMEKDYRLASKEFWQTVWRLRRGNQCPTNAVYSGGGQLLTSTGDVVGRWKKYFEDLLNPAVTSSIEEAEAEGSEVDSSITWAEVTEVVKKLLGGKAPGVDEIHPEYLKSLDVVGLSWRTRLCSIAGITLLSLPGKVYAKVLEKRIRPIVEPWIQEEQCGFHPGRGTLDHFYTLYRVLEGSWELAQPIHMCFVDLEKAFDCVPRGVLWRVLWEYGVRGSLLRAVRSLYDRSRSLVRIASSKSDFFPVHVGLRQGCPLSPVLFIFFMDRISRHSQGPEDVRFGDNTISSLLFADDVVVLAPSDQDLQHALGWFAAECEAAGMRISTSKSEAMVLSRKRVVCPLQARISALAVDYRSPGSPSVGESPD